MKFKIENILIATAIILCGLIILFSRLGKSEPQSVVVSTLSKVESVTANSSVKETQSDKSNLININTAGFEELKTLDGIGDVLAQRIIDYREETPFLSVEELINVKGIGEKTLETLKDKITVQ